MTTQAQATSSPPVSEPSPTFPLFYSKPTVLRFEAHGRMCFKTGSDYGFSRDATAVPISVDEFMPTVRNYPIVFAEGSLAPVAVLGVKQGENLFVQPDGSWKSGAYLPAYLRRYPFIFTEVPGTDNRALTIDETSDRLVDLKDSDTERRLFADDGTASPLAKEILQFCESFHRRHQASEAFVAALQEADLLVARDANIQFADKSTYQLRGFRIVDPARFRALPSATLTDWHAKGWLNAIALHLASQQNWWLLKEQHETVPEAIQ